MFESGGPGGDFSTYFGTRTEAFYRLDLGKVHYQKIPLTELLSPAIEREGVLVKVPDEVKCKICGSFLSPISSIPIHGEEFVDAFEL